ncbi:MAG: hypothetical protein HEP71_30250 [Roseivirga sp.]|nr:hypothetical protein [Roseivirga sp.]
MKNLKNYLLLSTLLMALATFLTSCSNDDEDPITREDFLGTYTAVESCDGPSEDKEVVISLGVMDNEVILSNMSDLHAELIGIVSADSLYIKDQDAITQAFGSLYFSNTDSQRAILREGKLELDYWYDSFNHCKATLTKKP